MLFTLFTSSYLSSDTGEDLTRESDQKSPFFMELSKSGLQTNLNLGVQRFSFSCQNKKGSDKDRHKTAERILKPSTVVCFLLLFHQSTNLYIGGCSIHYIWNYGAEDTTEHVQLCFRYVIWPTFYLSSFYLHLDTHLSSLFCIFHKSLNFATTTEVLISRLVWMKHPIRRERFPHTKKMKRSQSFQQHDKWSPYVMHNSSCCRRLSFVSLTGC